MLVEYVIILGLLFYAVYCSFTFMAMILPPLSLSVSRSLFSCSLLPGAILTHSLSSPRKKREEKNSSQMHIDCPNSTHQLSHRTIKRKYKCHNNQLSCAAHVFRRLLFIWPNRIYFFCNILLLFMPTKRYRKIKIVNSEIVQMQASAQKPDHFTSLLSQ